MSGTIYLNGRHSIVSNVSCCTVVELDTKCTATKYPNAAISAPYTLALLDRAFVTLIGNGSALSCTCALR